MNEKDKDKQHVDHIESSEQATSNTTNEEAPSEAWLRSERKIVRKLDMTLLPTVWTFICSSESSIGTRYSGTNADRGLATWIGIILRMSSLLNMHE
jgi:hypothetical protein